MDKTLEEQLIVNNQQVMALLINDPNTLSDNGTNESGYDLLKKTRDDAYILISCESRHMEVSKFEKYMINLHHYINLFWCCFKMEDQDGNAVHLPTNEKQSIMMALALHEKGKSIFRKKNYNDALIFFLEADQEYNNCTSEILNSVDNYALLNLDVVWCYLCLKVFIIINFIIITRKLYYFKWSLHDIYHKIFITVKLIYFSAHGNI